MLSMNAGTKEKIGIELAMLARTKSKIPPHACFPLQSLRSISSDVFHMESIFQRVSEAPASTRSIFLGRAWVPSAPKPLV